MPRAMPGIGAVLNRKSLSCRMIVHFVAGCLFAEPGGQCVFVGVDAADDDSFSAFGNIAETR